MTEASSKKYIEDSSDIYLTDLFEIYFSNSSFTLAMKKFNEKIIQEIEEFLTFKSHKITSEFLNAQPSKIWYNKIQENIYKDIELNKLEKLGFLLIKWRMLNQCYNKTNDDQKFNYFQDVKVKAGNDEKVDIFDSMINYDFSILITLFLFINTNNTNYLKYKSNNKLYNIFDEYEYIIIREVKFYDRDEVKNYNKDKRLIIENNEDNYLEIDEEETKSSISENKSLLSIFDDKKYSYKDPYLKILITMSARKDEIKDEEDIIIKTKNEIKSLISDYEILLTKCSLKIKQRLEWEDTFSRTNYVERIKFKNIQKLEIIKKEINYKKIQIIHSEIKIDKYSKEIIELRKKLVKLNEIDTESSLSFVEKFSNELEEFKKYII
jgi:hypothetical protein